MSRYVSKEINCRIFDTVKTFSSSSRVRYSISDTNHSLHTKRLNKNLIFRLSLSLDRLDGHTALYVRRQNNFCPYFPYLITIWMKFSTRNFQKSSLRLVKVLKIGAMKAMLYFMAQRKFCPYFLDVSADLVKIRHIKYPQNIVNAFEVS